VLAGRPLISALDNDEAGRRHTPGMVERLRAVARRGVVTVRTPAGEAKDWNDVLRARATAGKKSEAA
jgi:DNA primase